MKRCQGAYHEQIVPMIMKICVRFYFSSFQ